MARVPKVLIGKIVKVLSSKNRSLEGVKGVVADETKNMLTIETDGKTMRIVKSHAVFGIEVDGKMFSIDGKTLVGRPEDKIRRERF